MGSATRVVWWGGALILMGATAKALESGTKIPGEWTLELLAIVVIGIGGSLIASGLATRLITEHFFGLDIREAIEALRGASAVYRSNQTVQLTLVPHDEDIYVTAEHSFDLHSLTREARPTLRLYSSVVKWASKGDFDFVTQPDRTTLRGEELRPYLRDFAGKPLFERAYSLRGGAPQSFVIGTYGWYRTSDRLAWTVDHISKDFRVRVNNYTRLPGAMNVRINHHREREITSDMMPRSSQEGEVIEFSFLGEVLPYQDFELQWSFVRQAPDSHDGQI